MADFAKVLAAVDQVTGWSWLATYLTMGTHLAEEVVEGNALAVAVRELAEVACGGTITVRPSP